MKITYYGPYGLFLRFLPCVPSLLPGLIALDWYTWPFLVLWTACGVLRSHYYDPKIVQDSLIFGAISAFLLRDKLLELPNSTWKEILSLDLTAKPTPLTLVRAFAILLVLAGTIFWIHQERVSSKNRSDEFQFPPEFIELIPPDHPKALIYPCRTTHARVFPKNHAFAYSYLLYGIPIFPKVISPDGTRCGVLNDSKEGKWWLQVRAEDYLQRGFGEFGFYEKLKMTLKAQVCCAHLSPFCTQTSVQARTRLDVALKLADSRRGSKTQSGRMHIWSPPHASSGIRSTQYLFGTSTMKSTRSRK
jgi:hypothetical protein